MLALPDLLSSLACHPASIHRVHVHTHHFILGSCLRHKGYGALLDTDLGSAEINRHLAL